VARKAREDSPTLRRISTILEDADAVHGLVDVCAERACDDL